MCRYLARILHIARRRFPNESKFQWKGWKICIENPSGKFIVGKINPQCLNCWTFSGCMCTHIIRMVVRTASSNKCSHFTLLKHFLLRLIFMHFYEYDTDPSLTLSPSTPSSFCFFSHTLCSWNIFYLSSFSIIGNEYLASSYENGIRAKIFPYENEYALITLKFETYYLHNDIIYRVLSVSAWCWI